MCLARVNPSILADHVAAVQCSAGAPDDAVESLHPKPLCEFNVNV
jgi:hypothetical protein